MSAPSSQDLDDLWARHHAEWRDTAQVTSQWQEASDLDPRLLHFTVQGDWWDVIDATGATLFVTREYEHLVMAIGTGSQGPALSYMGLPHPSGLAVDRAQNLIYVASTRNPNQVFDLRPAPSLMPRLDAKTDEIPGRYLVPVRSRFYPGCLYMHDLALIGKVLYANAVGQNAVVQLHPDGRYERVWWPRCIEREAGAPIHGQNHLQLNSIATGVDLKGSFFSASTDKISFRRPGHQNFPVDKRGVIFSGETREPVVRGLTRPHSARLHDGRLWVDNSGYGELGVAENGAFVPVTRLPGWTRGLCFYDHIAFVGTSRVIPRFRHYAPGLDVDSSQCGIHAVDTRSGRLLGSLLWPYGNQIFAIDWISSQVTSGFPFQIGAKRATRREKLLFYAFEIEN